jgi:hypothetical protein
MRRIRPVLRPALVAAFAAVSSTGCDVLAALFDQQPLRVIVVVVAVAALVGFLVSRAARRR